MTKYYVGQELTYFTGPNRTSRVPVTKIARKYGYVKVYGREVPFDLETGRGKNEYGHGDWVKTDAELQESRLRDEAMSRVEPLNRSYASKWGSLTVDQINRIADIIEENDA